MSNSLKLKHLSVQHADVAMPKHFAGRSLLCWIDCVGGVLGCQNELYFSIKFHHFFMFRKKKIQLIPCDNCKRNWEFIYIFGLLHTKIIQHLEIKHPWKFNSFHFLLEWHVPFHSLVIMEKSRDLGVCCADSVQAILCLLCREGGRTGCACPIFFP